MDKIIKCVLISLLCATAALAAKAGPFLVCNPVTDPSITSYVISGLPTANLTVPATVNSNGTVQLHLDMGQGGVNISNGTYTVTAVAVNAFGASPASTPFTFSRALPVAPSSLSLSPN